MIALAQTQTISPPNTVRINTGRLTDWAIGLAVFSGGFVLFEPAPYELFLAGLMAIFFLLGMRLHRGIMPFLIASTLFAVGGFISSFMIEDYMRGVIYNLVTLFLGFTTVFFALVIYQEMSRLRLIFRAYVIAAVISVSLGIAGYFGVPGFEIFTLYDRAKGAFADPNVFAPFLIPPMLYLIYGVMNRSVTLLPVRALLLTIIMLGILLAFSRAAWGLTVLSGGMFYCLLLMSEPNARTRAKYILLGVIGMILMIVGLAAALQVEAVYDLFAERAQVLQGYDSGRLGRFARHAIGFDLATTNPLGIGNLEFGFLYGADEHNVYLRALLSYGWLGFVSWLAMVILPIVAGFPLLFRDRPWKVYFQIAYVVFAGHLIVGWVIDIDHWRHVYLLMGILWGCIMLEQKWLRDARASQSPRLINEAVPSRHVI